MRAVDPLTAAEFARLMAAFALKGQRDIAIAVSGGPDSMALAFCLKRWAEAQAPVPRLIGLIVDHGLRAESAKEAKNTQKLLQNSLKIEAEILVWQPPALTSGLHSAARKARYGLLIEACRRHDCRDLFLGHQREDQAETILMRLAKGSGVDGLAGMAQHNPMDGINLWRVLLDEPKARLLATCEAASLPYILDPSNASPRFARGRLRQVMPLLADEGLTIERLVDLGSRAAEAKQALNFYAGVFIRETTSRDIAGTIRLELAALRAAPRAVSRRVLALALQQVNPKDYAPDYQATGAMLDGLTMAAAMPSRTLHGCLISKTATHAVILREFASITDETPLAPGEEKLWDGRWRVRLSADSTGSYRLKALSNPPHQTLDGLAPNLRRLVPQGRSRAALPALWREDKLIAVPELSLDLKAMAHAALAQPWPPFTIN